MVAWPSDGKTNSIGHTVVRPDLSLVEAKYVEGPCVDEIARFISGHAFLSSGQVFRVRSDGSVQLHRPQGKLEGQEQIVGTVKSLPDYKLLTTYRLFASTAPKARGLPYLGIFKSKSDYVIARFDLQDGKLSKQADILIRSRLPLDAIDYLPAPDTPVGRFGFVQRVGADKAWLYTYDWKHGRLRPLAF